MIVDHLENADLYLGLHRRIDAALQYLREQRFEDLAPGRYDIDAQQVFALVQDYDTKPSPGARAEAHRRYIDVQYVVRGTEALGYARTADLAAGPYDPEKDVLFLDGNVDFMTLRPHTFAILFPHDAHIPGIALDTPQPVRKVVVKVAIA